MKNKNEENFNENKKMEYRNDKRKRWEIRMKE